MDLAGAPSSFASSSPTRPGRQLRLYLEVRAVRELGRLHTKVKHVSLLPARKTRGCYSTLRAPSSCTHGYVWRDTRQTRASWSLFLPNKPFWKHRNILRHHQDVRMTDTGAHF